MALDTGFLYWLSRIGQMLVSWGKVIAAVFAFVMWVFGLIDKIIGEGLTMIMDKLEAIDVNALQGANFAVLNNIGYVNAVMPLSEMVAIMAIYMTAWVVVVVVRWIKSFIPTIGN